MHSFKTLIILSLLVMGCAQPFTFDGYSQQQIATAQAVCQIKVEQQANDIDSIADSLCKYLNRKGNCLITPLESQEHLLHLFNQCVVNELSKQKPQPVPTQEPQEESSGSFRIDQNREIAI